MARIASSSLRAIASTKASAAASALGNFVAAHAPARRGSHEQCHAPCGEEVLQGQWHGGLDSDGGVGVGHAQRPRAAPPPPARAAPACGLGAADGPPLPAAWAPDVPPQRRAAVSPPAWPRPDGWPAPIDIARVRRCRCRQPAARCLSRRPRASERRQRGRRRRLRSFGRRRARGPWLQPRGRVRRRRTCRCRRPRGLCAVAGLAGAFLLQLLACLRIVGALRHGFARGVALGVVGITAAVVVARVLARDVLAVLLFHLGVAVGHALASGAVVGKACWLL